MPRIATGSRVCPGCGGSKGYYAKACRRCKVWPKPMLGHRKELHPTWKGGLEIDRDGYVRRYAPDHPWPRRNRYVLEHVRVMELQIGRRILPGEVVHHRDHDRQHNNLSNLELTQAGRHSREHRLDDVHRRRRDAGGRFA